ncbi:NUDIX hydrolase [Cryptosporangium sp. NPDC048952]|uniref:NUDIX hydrolase n=1 Tax=Cryptosporangium sp. NPDC048952 TaxID=3363961 RepID=UPI00371E44CF
MLLSLLTDYQPKDDVEKVDHARALTLAAGEDPWSRSTPVHITASALVVHPPTKRVLLRWHARQQAWLQVGGHADPGETHPLEIALREGREEAGLTDLVSWPDAGLRHVVVVPAAAGKGEPAHEHIDVRFVLATDSPDDVRPEKPDAKLEWLSVSEATARTSEPNLREFLARVGELF